MVDEGRRGGCPLTGLTGALNPSLGSSGAPAPRRGAHFESLTRGLIDAQTPVLAADVPVEHQGPERKAGAQGEQRRDRKSTRLNSSHGYISYAVFCLKKKNITRASHSSRV